MESSLTALVVVTLSLCLVLVWLIWYTFAHLAAVNRRQAKLLEDAMTHLWSARLASDPEQAAAAVQLEAIARPAPPYPRPAPMAEALDPWLDDASMARS